MAVCGSQSKPIEDMIGLLHYGMVYKKGACTLRVR